MACAPAIAQGRLGQVVQSLHEPVEQRQSARLAACVATDIGDRSVRPTAHDDFTKTRSVVWPAAYGDGGGGGAVKTSPPSVPWCFCP